MLKAAIDIGTNTVRYIAGRIAENSRIEIVSEGRRIVRLGEKVRQTGRISEAALSRLTACLDTFGRELTGLGIRPETVNAAATSAMRDAVNAGEVIGHVREHTGILIRVISGAEEGAVTMAGINAGIAQGAAARNGHTPPSDFMAVDIGGGSTEFIYSDPKAELVSLNLGIVHLTEKYIGNPPQAGHLEAARREIAASLAGLPDFRPDELVGTAGTVTTLAHIDSGHEDYRPELLNNYIVEKKSVERIFSRMVSMSEEERLGHFRLEKGREDIIISGILILLTIMDKYDYNHLHVSDYGLREGLLMQVLKNT